MEKLNLLQRNIRYLRKSHIPKLNQQEFADEINQLLCQELRCKSIKDLPKKMQINGKNIGGYEQGTSNPEVTKVIPAIAEFFDISCDELIKEDISRSKKTPSTTSRNKDNIFTIDTNTDKNIELVQVKAAAGYLSNYDNDDYTLELPRFQLPFLPKDRFFRAFEIEGESMLPLPSGSIVICEQTEKQYIKSGDTYIIITENDGVVYKRVYNEIERNGQLLLMSDNPDQRKYSPFSVNIDEVHQVWRAHTIISDSQDFGASNGTSIYGDLLAEIKSLRGQIERYN